MLIPNKPGVYIIIVSDPFITGSGSVKRFYIGGSSTSMENRIQNHIWKIKDGSHPSRELMDCYRKGYDFDFYPLIEFEDGEKTKEEIFEIEKRMIYIFQTDDNYYGFNTNKKCPKRALFS